MAGAVCKTTRGAPGLRPSDIKRHFHPRMERAPMNKYKKLTRNTGIFFLGESAVKIVAFFMLRYYTSVFSLSEYGIADLIITTAVFLEPLITLGINQGVFRFSMDRDIDHSKVLTIGIALAFAGNLLLWIL
ncbi:MAG: hypothetical protein PHO41_00915, partial [Eubacteriales bacterium]|nr:hypothetical protein [Eubacteriales bacterium]